MADGKRASRKRRQRERAAAGAPSPAEPDAMQRGYARSRERNEEVRAQLKPLRPGERPLAVTIGAVVAAVLAVANIVALAFGYNADEGNLIAGSVLVSGVLALVAYGMWRAKYWAVLGMQTLLAITLVFAALALLTAVNVWAAILMLIIIALAGALFWFLVKAMARIQMPPRPGSQS
jgi:cation transport ATPase